MSYEEYRGMALEAIGQLIFSQPELREKPFETTAAQAKEVFHSSVRRFPHDPLALCFEQYGARFLQDLPVLWSVFLSDVRAGRV